MGIVLCPTDFSDQSREALGYAYEVARRRRDKLLIFHVRQRSVESTAPEPNQAVRYEISDPLGISPQSVQTVKLPIDDIHLDNSSSTWQNSLATDSSQDAHPLNVNGDINKQDADFIPSIQTDVDYEVIVKEGDPVEEILKIAKSAAVSQIIMGTLGRPGFRRVILGHISEQIVQRAPCPVTVIRNPHDNQTTDA